MTNTPPRDTNASAAQQSARDELGEMFASSPIPAADLMSNFGLYMRSSALVKFLVLDDLYRRILNVPGAIVEFGCWWGQNLVVFENLRAIYEPFNKTRKIVGFDSFTGYVGHSQLDSKGPVFAHGNFGAGENYPTYLRSLLDIHEKSNVMGHVPGEHELVEGDIRKTSADYFKKYPGLTVALAYCDVGLYEPTLAALSAIKPHLIPGSVVLLDEFTWSEASGEAVAFREVFSDVRFKIEKQPLTPMRAIVTVLS